MMMSDAARYPERLDDVQMLAEARTLPRLLSKSTHRDRVTQERVMGELAKRLSAFIEIRNLGCGRDECRYPIDHGLIPGVDVDIDGCIWPGSPYAAHLHRCPSRYRSLEGPQPTDPEPTA